jgi:putative modified peptide
MSNEKSPLSTADAVTLLELLTTDPTFRLAFQANPADALRRISPEAAAAAVDCCMPGELASIETLTASRELLTEQLTTTSVFSLPFCFVDRQGAPNP